MLRFFTIGTHYVGIAYWIPLSILFVFLLIFSIFLFPPLFKSVLTWVFILSPLWAPITLFLIWWANWKKYIRSKFIAGQQPILLEFKIPRQIFKTPRAMEYALTGLGVGPGETTFIDRLYLGKVRPWWSLELVSIEGNIHFYIWTWERLREFTESQFYAQYPDIEIHEVEDYTAGIKYVPGKNVVWGMEYALAKPDAYPIKTYIDFELDQNPHKPEQMVDPLTGVFEKMSTLGPGEQMWVQILIRQNKGAPSDHDIFRKSGSWKDEAKNEIEKIYNNSKPQEVDLATGEVTEGNYPLLKPGEVNMIKALERSIEKPGFDAGIRSIYITRPDSFKGHKISPVIVNLFNSFASGYLNKFKPSDTWHVTLDYPWQDFMDIRASRFSHKVIDAYRRRSLFHPPYQRPRFVLTTEEVATIFHFPTEENKAPGIQRISSTKGEAPTNLPT